MVTLHAADVVLPIIGEPLTEAAVAVEGERVVGVGPLSDLASAHRAARVRRWRGVLTPGLVNAHTHLQYSAFADLAASRLPFPAWLRALAGRRRAMTDAGWAESQRAGLFLALRSGTTAAADVVTDPAVLIPTARSGIGGISYLEAIGAEPGAERDHLTRLARAIGSAPAGLTLGVSPHTLYTISLAAFEAVVGLARERALRLHPHLAESADETEFVALGTGRLADLASRAGWRLELLGCGAACSPTTQLDRLGALGPDVHVAHGVHCDGDDRALLRARGTYVALCPRSNQALRAGRAPVAAYLDEGNPIALGTDSLASSPSLDLLEQARAARDLARAQGYDGPDLARRLVEAATVGGARAMGLADRGYLAPGARADLAVFDVPTGPGADPCQALVEHGPGECAATVLGGRIVHRRQ